jgi:hypothetical protein
VARNRDWCQVKWLLERSVIYLQPPYFGATWLLKGEQNPLSLRRKNCGCLLGTHGKIEEPQSLPHWPD